MTQDISGDLLRKLLRYEPETGKLFWLHRTNDIDCRFRQFNSQFAGKEALYGMSASHGYRAGSIFAKQYLAHRVIWALIHDEWPSFIDHINGDRTDNRLKNLRTVTKSENAKNMAISKRNKSGTIGIYWAGHARKWRAEIMSGGKRRHLGYFTDIASASAARKMAERELDFHENHGRVA